MGAFNHNLGKYTLLRRTLHREGDGGYETWRFEIDDKNYIYYADVRYLSEIDERVIVVDFYLEEAMEMIDIDPFILTNTSNYHAGKVIGCVVELSVKILPSLRKYRYVAAPSVASRASFYKRLMNRFGTSASDEAITAIYKRLNYTLGIEIDSGISHCEVGDLIINPDFIAAGLDKKENRQKVDLVPVSAGPYVGFTV